MLKRIVVLEAIFQGPERKIQRYIYYYTVVSRLTVCQYIFLAWMPKVKKYICNEHSYHELKCPTQHVCWSFHIHTQIQHDSHQNPRKTICKYSQEHLKTFCGEFELQTKFKRKQSVQDVSVGKTPHKCEDLSSNTRHPHKASWGSIHQCSSELLWSSSRQRHSREMCILGILVSLWQTIEILAE